MARFFAFAALAVLTFERPLHAEPRRLRLERPERVKLRLWTAEPGLRLELYHPDEKPREFQPLAACIEGCTLSERRGRYRLFVEGRPDSDVHASFRDFKLRGPSDITVRPPSSSARTTGLVLGVVGIPMTFIGGLFFLGRTLGGGFESVGEQAVVSGVFLGGVTLTVTGWIVFGVNRKPRLKVTPLE